MFTPQEVLERSDSLEKAVFGGYSVSAVEELLGPLSEDYAALYKENAVLKSKMKVLVEKLEEYREQEDSIKKTLLKAQKAADEILANAERKSANMLSDTEQRMRSRSQELSAEMQAEQERVSRAKQAAARFIVEIEDRVQAQLTQLEQIKQMDLKTAPRPAEQAEESEDAAQTPRRDNAAPEEMAEEIGANISRFLDAQETPEGLGDTRVIQTL